MNIPKELKLKEIASRIYSHLKRFELAEQKWVKENCSHDEMQERHSDYFHSNAIQTGNRVSVTYISYQGGTKLTKVEALHYLQGLDNGYEGRHFEFFRQEPVPTGDEPKVRYMSLLRERYGWSLYGVVRRTAKRVYGEKIAGDGYPGQFVDRGAVFKVHATFEDLEAVRAAQNVLRDEQHQANIRYGKKLAEIKAIKRDFEPEELDEDDSE